MLKADFMRCCLVFVIFLPVSSALAINKCTDPATGKITYSDLPCPGATEKEDVELHNVEAPSGSSAPVTTRSRSGLRPDEQRRLDDIHREEREREFERNLDDRIADRQRKLEREFDRIDDKYDEDLCDIYTKRLKRHQSRARSSHSSSESVRIREDMRAASEKMREHCN